MAKFTINVDFDIVANDENEAAKELAKRLENAFFSIADCRIIEVNNFLSSISKRKDAHVSRD